MKKRPVILAAALVVILLSGFSARAQNDETNRAYLGVYRNYTFPLFDLKYNNYKNGKGFSAAYLSRKLSLSDAKHLSLRIGATFGASGQGKQSFTLGYSDSLPKSQTFKNNYIFLDLLGRVTYEKHRIVKPYGEAFLGLGAFESKETFYPTSNKKTRPAVSYSASPVNFGISAGCMIRIIDAVYLDGKITFTQSFTEVAFIDLDNFTRTNTYYEPQRKDAAASLLTFQIGVLLRIPRASIGWGSSNDGYYPEPKKYSSPSKPSPSQPKQDTPSELNPQYNQDKPKPKENNKPNERPRIRH